MKHQRSRGFTLTELMIVVAIIGIVSAIAYPSYQSYTQKTRRSAAQATLTEAAAQQEQYYLNFKKYTVDESKIGLSDTNYYDFEVVAPTGNCPITTCYKLSAAPLGTQQDDDCGTMTLSKGGSKTAGASGCW